MAKILGGDEAVTEMTKGEARMIRAWRWLTTPRFSMLFLIVLGAIEGAFTHVIH